MPRWIPALAALAAAALACGPALPTLPLPASPATPGPLQTLDIHEAPPEGGEAARLTLSLAPGNLQLSGGGDGLVSGRIEYNMAAWRPEIRRDGPAVAIEQSVDSDGLTLPAGDVINRWDLRLGDGPLELTLSAGAYQGQVDLGGLRLRRLEINDGASTSLVRFDQANPETMSLLKYATGASQVTLTGLANANFTEMVFDGGAGTYVLDFSGALQRDARVTVRAGVCTLTIRVPTGTPVVVTAAGAVTTVTTQGTWAALGNTYRAAGAGPQLTIDVDMGLGTLQLERP